MIWPDLDPAGAECFLSCGPTWHKQQLNTRVNTKHHVDHQKFAIKLTSKVSDHRTLLSHEMREASYFRNTSLSAKLDSEADVSKYGQIWPHYKIRKYGRISAGAGYAVRCNPTFYGYFVVPMLQYSAVCEKTISYLGLLYAGHNVCHYFIWHFLFMFVKFLHPHCRVDQFWPIVEDWDWETIFSRHYRSIFNHCDITGLQSYRSR